jgi:hypothetical protein
VRGRVARPLPGRFLVVENRKGRCEGANPNFAAPPPRGGCAGARVRSAADARTSSKCAAAVSARGATGRRALKWGKGVQSFKMSQLSCFLSVLRHVWCGVSGSTSCVQTCAQNQKPVGFGGVMTAQRFPQHRCLRCFPAPMATNHAHGTKPYHAPGTPDARHRHAPRRGVLQACQTNVRAAAVWVRPQRHATTHGRVPACSPDPFQLLRRSAPSHQHSRTTRTTCMPLPSPLLTSNAATLPDSSGSPCAALMRA